MLLNNTELRVFFFFVFNSTHSRLTLLFVDFVFSTRGGMLMDPFRPGGMGSTGGQGFGPPPHPGQLPRFVISGDFLSFSSNYISL